MNKRRLLKLADLLTADAKRKDGIKFNLRTWGSVRDTEQPVSCKTTACAMGLAALSGAFKPAGLRAQILWGNVEIEVLDKQGYQTACGGIDSAIELFKINYGEAVWLFLPWAYRGKALTHAPAERMVAKRIRDFVAGKASPAA